MKDVKRLFILLFICLSMFIGVNNIFADSFESKFEVSTKGYGSTNGTEIYGLMDVDSNIVYCLNEGKEYKGGVTYTNIGTYNNSNSNYACGVLNYISENFSLFFLRKLFSISQF